MISGELKMLNPCCELRVVCTKKCFYDLLLCFIDSCMVTEQNEATQQCIGMSCSAKGLVNNM